MNVEVKVGDRVMFRHHEHYVSQGIVMWFDPDGAIQISDSGDMKCQNWVIRPEDVIKLSPFVV